MKAELDRCFLLTAGLALKSADTLETRLQLSLLQEVDVLTPITLKPVLMFIVIASGPSLPHVDIYRTCVAAAGGDGVEKCVADETYARNKLRKHWKQIPSSFKTQCLFDPPPPDASYIVLRDCINNNEILRQIHKRPGSSQAQ